VVIASLVLVWEHRLVRPYDYARLDAAFFTMNGVISGIVMLGAVTDVLF
jgi:4-hydroxybenzoate polyprenyltransferase